jgi:hypothetical protein
MSADAKVARKNEQPAQPGALSKTMVFGGAAGGDQASVKSNASAGMAKTMLGVPAAGGREEVSAKPPVAQAQPATTPAVAKPVPAQPEAQVQPKAAPFTPARPKPSPGAVKGGAAKTVLGMAAVSPEPAAPKKSAAVPMAAPAKSAQPAAKAKPGLDKRTVLGMPAVGGAEAAPPPVEPAPAPQPEPASVAPATPEPEKDPAQPAQQAPAQQPREPAAAVRDDFGGDDWDDDLDSRSTGKPVGLFIALGLVGVVVVAAVVLLVLFLDGSERLTPQLFRTPDGKAITVGFSFPDAPAGTTIAVADQTANVVQGQAQIKLSVANLVLGENEIPLVYTEPGQAPETKLFALSLRHSVSTALAGLSAEKPFVDVGFKVAEGMSLAVEGKPVQLVGGGYTHRLEIGSLLEGLDPNADNLVHNLAFQLTDDDGAAEQGHRMIEVPVTDLVIDRPADKTMVAADSVTCAGRTEDGAQVKVNGKAVGVSTVGFNKSVLLPSLKEHEIVIEARAPGKAPRLRKIRVTRIESFDVAIEQWSKDLEEKLAYPALARDPNAHSGKKVRLTGRVVNINTEKGVTAFLLYIAGGCPAGARCAVYVLFRGETEAGLQSWVDVYGKVTGSRAVDLPQGQKLEVPAVDASFVLETKHKKKRRRGR